jgi:hypothetical protein
MQRAGTITPVNSRVVIGGGLGVTACVAVAGSGVRVGELDEAARICRVAEAARRGVGEAVGNGCANTPVGLIETAGVVVPWQPLASKVKVSKLATSLLVMRGNRLWVYLDRLDKRAMGW